MSTKYTPGPWEADGPIIYGRSTGAHIDVEICQARSEADAAHIVACVNSAARCPTCGVSLYETASGPCTRCRRRTERVIRLLRWAHGCAIGDETLPDPEKARLILETLAELEGDD